MEEDEEAYMDGMAPLDFSGSTEISDYSYDYMDRKLLTLRIFSIGET